uniref:ATP synthase subunit a n=1 Tax=Ceratophysella communis TaxID=1519100 RepID=A0A6G6A4K8_9HEXA|nr:ATP synthase F0 subunit 6 [Ceratophysella communis]QID03190.1 ATP synthase F0 subunit 6 [Ceratophysella communis]
MMTNLFSVFDPASSVSNNSNWISASIIMTIMMPLFWLVPNRINLVLTSILMTLHYEFKNLLGPSSFKGSTLSFLSLFIFVVINNFLGLFPYIFTSTSHLSTTLTLAAPIWVSFMLFGWFNYSKHMFAHLVPQSTPVALMPFMVLIETISNVIRPGTLAVRLAANMIAGHLLMTLLGNQTTVAGVSLVGILLAIQVMLLILESAVAMIQAYVFAVLSTLYSSEITQH